MPTRTKLAISGACIALGIALIATAFLFHMSEGGSGHGYGSAQEPSLTGMGWAFVMIGILLIVLSLVYPAIPLKSRETKTVARLYPDVAIIDLKEKEALRTESDARLPSTLSDESGVSMEQMALRLLEGDERRVYRRVVESGGEILQKDIVSAVPFSKAKVSRIVNRLEEKGLITKRRHGYTNKIVLVKQQ